MVELYGDEAVNELAYHFSQAGDSRAGHYLIRAGDEASARYANEEAIRFYARATDFVDEPQKLDTWEKMGDIQFMLGEYKRANEHYGKILAAAEDPGTDARIMRKMGEFQTRRGTYEDAVSTFVSARELLDEDDAETGRLLVSEGYTHYFTGGYNKAMALFLKALMVFESADAEPGDTGKVLRAIGNIHYLRGEYEMAVDYFDRSLKVMESSEDIQGIAAALNNIGVVHNDRGELDKALEFYERSLEIVSKTGAKTFIAQALNNFGIVYNSRGELEEALDYMRRGLEMERKSGDSRGIAESLNNIGVVYVDMGEREKALEHYLKSLEIRERIGDKRGIGFSYYNVGNSYAHKKEYDNAEEHYRKSLDICTELGDGSMAVYNLSGLTVLTIEKGDLPEALGQVDAGKLLGETVYEHAMLHKAMGDPEKARTMFEDALSMFAEMGLVEWKARTEKALEEL
jgi:tetratricopeptide (TPR) repeat protein